MRFFKRDTGAARLPSIPKITVPDPGLRSWINAVTEWIEVRSGSRGNASETAVTKRELDELASKISLGTGTVVPTPDQLAIKLPNGLNALVSVNAFAEALRNTKLFRDLTSKIDDQGRLDAFAAPIRSLLEVSIATEAQKRGADIRRTDLKIQTLDQSFAAAVTEITAALDDNAAGLSQLQAAYADSTTAQAAQITKLETSLGNYYQDGAPGRAILEQTLSTTASQVTGLESQYTLKVQAGGAIAGIGLAATESNGVPSSAFIVNAEKFAVVTPSYAGGATNTPSTQNIPFGVDASGVYINGQVRINAAGPSVSDIAARAGIRITYTAGNWRTNGAGQELVATITLGIQFSGSLTGTVTWSADGVTSPVPTPASNTWVVYAADQTGDTVTYTATLTVAGITYTDAVTIVRIRDGIKGETGDRGGEGSTGSLTGYGSNYGISSSVWSDSVASRVIYNMLTGQTLTTGLAATDHLLLGDTVTLSNGSSFAETRYWSGTAWLVPGVVIDGNLLVNGTVSADKVTAGSITTGQSANSSIIIGNTSHVGTIKSPFHVTKSAAASAQTLISARNDKDDSVSIWGSSVYTAGNAVSGTWHDTVANANAGRWKMIGLLGSDGFGAAVVGNVYNSSTRFGGWFRYFTTESDSASPSVAAEVKLATSTGGATRAVVATGKVQLLGSGSSLILNTDEGASGQVLTSQGPGVTPIWTTPATGGSVTFSSIQTALSPAQSTPLDLGATFRATKLTAPGSGAGLEVAYDATNNQGYVISYDRTASAYKPLNISGSTILLTGSNGANSVALGTSPTTENNSTAVATTAFVKAQGYTSTPLGSATPLVAGTASAGSSTSAARADHRHPKQTDVNGYKCFGGSGTANGSGNFSVTFPSAFTSEPGVSAVSTTGNYVVVTSASTSSVTFQVQSRSTGAAVASAGIRWTAVGGG